MRNENAIDIQRLSKAFRDTLAVDDVSFAVRPGEIFGFMAHNGAGKTTTLRNAARFAQATRGEARVLGYDIVSESIALRRVCGFLPADCALPKDMTARASFGTSVPCSGSPAGWSLERRDVR